MPVILAKQSDAGYQRVGRAEIFKHVSPLGNALPAPLGADLRPVKGRSEAECFLTAHSDFETLGAL
jgi:hypothetical protein